MRIYDVARIEEAFPVVHQPEHRPGGSLGSASLRAQPPTCFPESKNPSHAAPLSGASVDELLASVGPNHWHTPVLRAVAKLVAQGLSDGEILTLVEPATLPGWTVEQTRREVQGMINSARRKGFDVSKPRPGPLKPDVSPAYPASPLPAAEASTRLRGAIEDWFAQAGKFAESRRALKELHSSQYGPDFISKVRSEMFHQGILPAPLDEVQALADRHARRTRARETIRLKKKLLKKFGLSNLKRGPRRAIQAAAGLGKTAEVVRYIREHPELWKLHIWIFVPTLDLAEQLATCFGPEPGRSALYVRVMRGRLAKATDEREKGEPKTMCRKPKAAELAGNKLGLNVFKSLCKRGEDFCLFYDRCPWIEQWNDSMPGIRIFAHEYLFLPKLPQFPKPDLVISDESFVEAAVGRVNFSPDRLVEPAPWKNEEVVGTLESLRAVLEGDKPLLATLRESGLSRHELAAALEAAEESLDGESNVAPGMGEEESVRCLTALEESERVKVARALRQLVLEIDLPRDICHSVFLRRNMPVRVNGTVERQNRVVVTHRRKLMLSRRVPVLTIDADSDPAICRRLFGEVIEHVHIPVERNAEVVQCYSSTFSKQSMLGFSGASERALAWAEKRLQAVKNFIRSRAERLSTLAVANLPVRRKLSGEEGERVSLAFEWGPTVISHFGRIRGIDLWKDRQAVVIVGREQPRAEDVETIARGLCCDDPEALHLCGAYAKALRGYRLKDGRRLGVEVDIHPDPRVQGVLELKRERESAQAIDRIRLVHADSPKTVWILCNVPLDIDVDRLVSWRELVGGGCRLDQALRRNGWALPLVPACLSRNWPDLFRSAKAAEIEIARFCQTNPMTIHGAIGPLKSQQGICWLLRRSKFRPVLEGKGGHRRWSEALLAADTPSFRVRIREAMGCDLIWEQPPTGQVFYKPNRNGGHS